MLAVAEAVLDFQGSPLKTLQQFLPPASPNPRLMQTPPIPSMVSSAIPLSLEKKTSPAGMSSHDIQSLIAKLNQESV